MHLSKCKMNTTISLPIVIEKHRCDSLDIMHTISVNAVSCSQSSSHMVHFKCKSLLFTCVREVVLLYPHLSARHNVGYDVFLGSILIDSICPLRDGHHITTLLENCTIS